MPRHEYAVRVALVINEWLAVFEPDFSNSSLAGSEGKNDPARSLGIRNSRSPAVPDKVRSRCPVRAPVRSCGRRRSPSSARPRSAPGRSPRPPAGSGHRPRRPSVLQHLQHLQQCRLVQGHRVSVSFRENHWRGLAEHHTVALPACPGTPSRPNTYTTRRDATDEYPDFASRGSAVESCVAALVRLGGTRAGATARRTRPVALTCHSPVLGCVVVRAPEWNAWSKGCR